MDKLIEFFNSFKNLNFKDWIFKDLNLLPFLAGAFLLVLFLKLLIYSMGKRKIGLGVSSLALFSKKKSLLRHIPELLFILGVVVLILVLLNPVLPLLKHKKNIATKDIMIVLDFSSSMENFWYGSGEYNYSKLEVELGYVIKFIETRKDDFLGLIVYSSNPYLANPLNYKDHESLIGLLKLFGVSIVKSIDLIPGETQTATGEALLLANEYLKEYGQSKQRTIVLFTDGESNLGRSPEAAFEEIKKSKFRVFVLGINYYTDPSAQQLAQMAIESGGNFFPIENENNLREAVYSIDRLVGKNQITIDEYVVDDPQYFYLGFVCLVLFILALCLKHLHYFRDLL